MKKTLTSLIFTVAFAFYGLYQYVGGTGTVSYVAATTTPATSPIASAAPSAAPSSSAPPKKSHIPTPTPKPTPAPVPTPKPKGQYADGTYTGSVADAYYGNVEVRATISGGKLADVAFLQYPNDRRTSQYINSQAMPQLRSEAIQAQSAQVDTVSGASETSGAFRQSLASALAQAKN